MEFFREISKYLDEWRGSIYRKPLVLRGARQVGKTTLVRQFSKKFKYRILLNLETSADLAYFQDYAGAREILEVLLVKYQIPSDGVKDTLLFIDEIQESPFAIQQLRYFYEFIPDLCVIAAGSLLEFAVRKVSSMPVGRIEYLYIYPLNFSEYLLAKGEKSAWEALNEVPVRPVLNDYLLELFKRYAVIGGLPEIVKLDIEKNNLSDLGKVYESIWQSFIEDVEKYSTNPAEREVISYILQTAPTYVDQRVKFQAFGGSDYRSREVKEAFSKLEKAKIIRLIRPATEVEFPIRPSLKRAPRLQILDTGLVNDALGIQTELMGLDDLSSSYRGAIIPHMITQELLSLNVSKNRKPNFWVREKNQSSAEVDLLYAYRMKLIPIEIKSGPKGTLKSLHQFIDMASHIYAVRIYAGQFRIEKSQTATGKKYLLMNLPYYLGSKIPAYVAYFVDNYSLDDVKDAVVYEEYIPSPEMVREGFGNPYGSKSSIDVEALSSFSEDENKGLMVWPPEIDAKTDKVKAELSTLIQIVKLENGVRANILALRIGKSIATTERYIKLLRASELIEFIGAPKTGGYYLKD